MSSTTSQVYVAIRVVIMCSEAGEEMEQFMDLTRDDFIAAMLRMHAANSSRKWRLLIKNAKMENRTSLCPQMLKISVFGSMWQVVLIAYLTKKSENVS